MKTPAMNALIQLVKHHNLKTSLSLEILIDQIAGISSEHANLLTTIDASLKSSEALSKVISPEVFTECPNCGSHTLLNFTDCHLCGEHLVIENTATQEEVIPDTQEEVKEIKEEMQQTAATYKKTKDRPAALVPAIAEFEDDFADEPAKPVKEPVKESKKEVVKEKVKRTSKKDKIAPPPPANDFEDDFDLSIDAIDAEEAAEPVKAKVTQAKKPSETLDDEDDFSLDFDEEEKPVKTSVKPLPAKPATKVEVKKPAANTDDTDLDDFDFGEEDFKPTAKPVKPAPAKSTKPASKKVEVDEVLGEANPDLDITDFESEFDDDMFDDTFDN